MYFLYPENRGGTRVTIARSLRKPFEMYHEFRVGPIFFQPVHSRKSKFQPWPSRLTVRWVFIGSADGQPSPTKGVTC